MKEMVCRAVVFDLDGTLIDSLDDIAAAMNRVLASHRLPKLPAAKYRDLVGDGVRMLVLRAFAEAGSALDDAEPVISQYLAAYRRRCLRPCRFYPGIAELLDRLRELHLPMAIISNKNDQFTRLLVDRFFSAWPFAQVSGEKSGSPRKPDPAAATLFASRMGIDPGNVFFIGDSAVDMTTAKRAGMIGVGVSWGFRPVQELIENGALIILQKPVDLLSWINQARR